jgi:alpha-beta hydrolase superfamily lysophospholipase
MTIWRVLVILGGIYGVVCLLVAYFHAHPVRLGPWKTPAEKGLRYHDLTFTTADGLRLAAWFVPAPEARGVVILCHGYGISRDQMLPFLPCLHKAGFSCFLFDFRASGQSEGRTATAGKTEVRDLEAAVEYLGSQPDTAALPLGVLGLSMGGAVAILAAAHDTDIAGVVSDCAYADLEKESQQWLRGWFGPLAPIFVPTVLWLGKHLFGLDLKGVAPIEHVGAIAPRPILFIHGTADRLTRPQDAQELFDAAGKPKELWLVEGASHGGSYHAQPEEYERRVVDLFRRMRET